MLRRDLEFDWACVLAALYLPGATHGLHLDRRRWPAVLGVLRSLAIEAAHAQVILKTKGFFAESSALSASGALAWGEAQLDAEKVFTCFDGCYPERWLSVLAELAPPVAWKHPDSAANPSKYLGVVGSRQIEPEVHTFCAQVAQEASLLGYGVVSGGAMGCDRAALDAAAKIKANSLLLLPYGIDLFEGDIPEGQTVVSLSQRAEPFSTGRAMERNTLIYSAGSVCVVGQVRFREGGTWHGSVEALRRNLTRILVKRPDEHTPEGSVRGAKALSALGASYLADAGELGQTLTELPKDWGLFNALKAG